MSDEHSTEPMLRASAYLDGELDADEAGLAEADPAVMAEVARLRVLQAGVRGVEPPTHVSREAAIAAALAEFDTQHRPMTVIPIRPRPSYTRWLGVAAAVVVIGMLGVVISRSSSSDDGDGDAALEQTATSKLAPSIESSAGALDTASRSAATTAVAADEFDAAAESASAVALEAAPAPSVAASSAGGAPTEGSASESPIAPPFDPDVPIADDAELGVIGAQLLDQLTAGTITGLPESICNDGASRVVLADALLIVTDTTKAVLVAADPDTRETFALDPQTCAVLATGR